VYTARQSPRNLPKICGHGVGRSSRSAAAIGMRWIASFSSMAREGVGQEERSSIKKVQRQP
jgi:hypothetical protein